MAAIRILHLCDMPAAIPVLARWYEDAWAPWYGADGPGDALRDLGACASRDALPLCLVAVAGEDTLLGTAALKSASVGSELGVGPWLAALLVAPAHRGRGIAGRLADAVVAEAGRLGFAAVYTSTDADDAQLARRGWQPVGDSESLRGMVTVYRRQTAC